MTMKTIYEMKSMTTWVLHVESKLQSAECFSELAALANKEVVIDDHSMLDKKRKLKRNDYK